MQILTFWVQPLTRFRVDFSKKSCQLGLSGEKVWTIRGKLCGEILHWNVFSLHMNARAAPRRLGERRNFPQGPQCFGAAFLETLIRVFVPPPAPKVRPGALKSANSRSFSWGRGSERLANRWAGMEILHIPGSAIPALRNVGKAPGTARTATDRSW